MPILKRELDQYPPDLMQTEFESLERARASLDRVHDQPSAIEHATSDQVSSPSNGSAPVQVHDREPSFERDHGLVDSSGQETFDEVKGRVGDRPEFASHDLGTFGYFAEYLGQPAAPKPLTFWSGDWDDYSEFDASAIGWWCLYTHSRQEKVLMRHLAGRGVAFYCPMIEKRSRSPQGRMRSSYLPLFTNYVFLRGTDDDRRLALTTNCILASKPIRQPDFLVRDLWQINRALQSGVPMTPEQKLTQGDPVIVKSGPFKGFEGFVLRRAGTTRFLIYLRYLEQGVSMEIDEGALAAI
ncbi:MAG: hypothetical protein JNL67_09475 [Planctomycetaceae bacterium]|nr:hypothetical protein [Planctomycetaceae bacterium]